MKKIKTLADLTPDARNANRGSERGLVQLDDSLRNYGAGRSILADRDGRIIAGNKTLERAADMDLRVKVVETDGTELVVVQRTDLALDADDGKARMLAYADNRSAEVGLVWDAAVLAADVAAGVDLGALFTGLELEALLADVGEPGPGEVVGGDLGEKQMVTCPQCGEEFALE